MLWEPRRQSCAPCILRYPPRTRRSLELSSGSDSIIFTMSAAGEGGAGEREGSGAAGAQYLWDGPGL